MIIKTALILSIITAVIRYIAKLATERMGMTKLLMASINKEYPRHILILWSAFVVCLAATITMWIVAIITF